MHLSSVDLPATGRRGRNSARRSVDSSTVEKNAEDSVILVPTDSNPRIQRNRKSLGGTYQCAKSVWSGNDARPKLPLYRLRVPSLSSDGTRRFAPPLLPTWTILPSSDTTSVVDNSGCNRGSHAKPLSDSACKHESGKVPTGGSLIVGLGCITCKASRQRISGHFDRYSTNCSQLYW